MEQGKYLLAGEELRQKEEQRQRELTDMAHVRAEKELGYALNAEKERKDLIR